MILFTVEISLSRYRGQEPWARDRGERRNVPPRSDRCVKTAGSLRVLCSTWNNGRMRPRMFHVEQSAVDRSSGQSARISGKSARLGPVVRGPQGLGPRPPGVTTDPAPRPGPGSPRLRDEIFRPDLLRRVETRDDDPAAEEAVPRAAARPSRIVPSVRRSAFRETDHAPDRRPPVRQSHPSGRRRTAEARHPAAADPLQEPGPLVPRLHQPGAPGRRPSTARNVPDDRREPAAGTQIEIGSAAVAARPGSASASPGPRAGPALVDRRSAARRVPAAKPG